MYPLLILSFVGCVNALACRTVNNERITGADLWQRNFELRCGQPPLGSKGSHWLNITCRIGVNVATDFFHTITFEALESNNSISCALRDNSSDSWEMNDIDMNPMNETTFVSDTENQFIDAYIGYAQNFTLYNSEQEILKLSYPGSNYNRFSDYKIEKDDSIVSRVGQYTGKLGWVRIHFTRITTRHAGPWKIQKDIFQIFHFLVVKKTSTFDVNVVSDFTCVSNNSASCLAREFSSPIVELTCNVSRISQFQWKENIVCRLDSEILNSTSSDESKFLIDSSQRQGKRVVCFSENINQTWESSPIRFFHQEIVNTTKAISVANTNERNCKYSWIVPDFTEIFENVLDWFRMESHGYGKYLGIISCPGSCSYINFIVNFVDPTPSTTTTISPTTTFLFTSVVSNSTFPTTPSTNRRDFFVQIWFINTIVLIIVILVVCGIFWRLRKHRYAPVQQAVVV